MVEMFVGGCSEHKVSWGIISRSNTENVEFYTAGGKALACPY